MPTDTDTDMSACTHLSKMRGEKITSGACKELKNRAVRLVALDYIVNSSFLCK